MFFGTLRLSKKIEEEVFETLWIFFTQFFLDFHLRETIFRDSRSANFRSSRLVLN